ncbi:MAG: glycine cleavage system aminomethyltransferase GcvT [Candidatus Dadabacteria bacterium]|nr:glycine cleavage system aminomethyltransferase GcvT [Candidatus Dadabacteria bacterium]NIS10108.1 glycine cleavage system aminomethyltransferase GcvT [Candidatus Dadabacteria bacterium]NIY23045.1 glycine cleavage system aminomethyltransferase GcvT [Candidatus Dadabacteria bacterium]
MKKTALYENHKKSGAKIVEFEGWMMPVQYEGLRKEHLAVRSAVGIFDVSHMGEIEVIGADAREFCQKLTSNNINKIVTGQAQYSVMCSHSGGAVDDVISYMLSEDHFLICVNAANTDKDYKWISQIKNEFKFESEVINKSTEYSQIAVQGPQSKELLIKIFGEEMAAIKRFRFEKIEWNATRAIVARTGYTGEDGFEVFLPWGTGPALWDELIKQGQGFGLKECGLGCRDTLRLEMGYPLYGNELNDTTNPVESGLGFFVKHDDEDNDFVGEEAIIKQIDKGLKSKLVGFEMTDRGIARHGYNITSNSEVVGVVTSGTHSPSLDKSIGMGLISNNCDEKNLCVDIRDKYRKIEIVDIPFYKK